VPTWSSPDARLRFELALRDRGRPAAIGRPAVRVTFDRRVLLNWSPLAPREGGTWRLAACSAPASAAEQEGDVVAVFEPASGDGPAWRVTFRCAAGALHCRHDGVWPVVFRVPRDTLGWIADAQSAAGFSLRNAADALHASSEPVTCLYSHGKCAVLASAPREWRVLAADRPADLPAHPGACVLSGSATPTGAAAPRLLAGWTACPVGVAAAQFNCTAPYVITPVRGGIAAGPGGIPSQRADVTPAHAAALERIAAVQQPDEQVGCLRGEIGEYLLVARRRGRSWRLAGLTARARVWTLRLSFLEPGVSYRALWRLDPPPAKPLLPPAPGTLDATSRPLLPLADAGGFTLDLDPLDAPPETTSPPCCPP
jgi:hypothetical protein